MKKKKIILLAGAGVAVVLLLVAAFLLYRGISKLREVQAQLQTAGGQLDGFHSKNPFPSPANVGLEEKNVDLLKEWKLKLLEELQQNQVLPDVEKSPSAFISSMTDRVKKLTDEGRKLRKETVAEGFAFGFGRYFTADGARPVPPDVPRLTQQLLIIDSLTRAILEQEIEQLVSIEREEFEAGADRKKRARGNLSAAGLITEGDLFGKLHFTYELLVKERPLLNILNRLAKHEQFVVMTSLKISKTGKDVDIPDPAAEAERLDDEGIDPLAAAEAEEDASTKPKAERVVSGAEMERPMRVILDLDVYWFGSEGAE